MATLRYERVSDPDSSTSVDHVSVYNPEQIDDTAAIIGHSNDFDVTFTETIGLRDIFEDPRLSPKQQRICLGITFSVACITLFLMISLFVGFGKVLFDVIAYQEKLRHGLMMVPSLRKRPINIFHFNVRNGTANQDYVKEIDDYLTKYSEYQESMKEYLEYCSAKERSGETRWCKFDFKREFGDDCSKATNYGYDTGNPCILFVFEDQYQYSANVYVNITYYPPLPTPMRNGGFRMNLIPNRKITDHNGNEIQGKNGDVMYSLPPLLMVKMTFPSVIPRDRTGEIGPFTLDCRIKDNVSGYEFDNIKEFNGQTAVSFDFVPRFS